MSRADTLSDLEEFEGYRGYPYRCSAGFLTIGFGRNLDANPVSIDEARHLLLNDVDRAYHAAARIVPSFHLHSEIRQDVLAQMAFQLGEAGLAGFAKMIAALADGAYSMAAKEMRDSKWWRSDTRLRAEILARRMETNKRNDEQW